MWVKPVGDWQAGLESTIGTSEKTVTNPSLIISTFMTIEVWMICVALILLFGGYKIF